MLLGLAATGALPGCAGLDADAGSTMSRYPARNQRPRNPDKHRCVRPGRTPHRPARHHELESEQIRHPARCETACRSDSRGHRDLGGWPAGRGGGSDRVAALGLDPLVVSSDNPLLADAGSATTRVDFAQYGGLQADSASVLVVAEQWRTSPAGQIIHSGRRSMCA